MPSASEIVKLFVQKFGRAPGPGELVEFERSLGNTVPKPPGGITRENIESGYGYQSNKLKADPNVPGQMNVAPQPDASMSPLKRMLMIGGPAAALLGLYGLSQLGDEPSAPGMTPGQRSLLGEGSVTLPQKASAAAPGLKAAITKRKAAQQPEPLQPSHGIPPVVPQPPQAALMDEAALREYFNSGPYSLNIGNR